MNQAHVHLVLNHLPIIFPIVGLLVIIAGMFLRSEIVKRVAYSIFIIGALSAIAAFVTGEGAEDVVEKIQGVSEQFIKAHEEIAETFAVFSYLLGAISLVAFWANWKQKSFSNGLCIGTIGLCIVVLLYAQKTGTTGGEIRHTEIRAVSAVNSANPELNTPKKSNSDDD
jgi:uncharacterized membrane protein